MQRKLVTPEMAVPKIRYYCAYQERSQSEVRDKLYKMGLWKKDVETIIADLISENYINEERFATLFAGGKFRIKHWGKTKIKWELKQKQISDYCIKIALGSIDEEDYQKTFLKVARDRWKALKKETNMFAKKQKLRDHLMLRGYEYEMVARLFHKELEILNED